MRAILIVLTSLFVIACSGYKTTEVVYNVFFNGDESVETLSIGEGVGFSLETPENEATAAASISIDVVSVDTPGRLLISSGGAIIGSADLDSASTVDLDAVLPPNIFLEWIGDDDFSQVTISFPVVYRVKHIESSTGGCR